MEEENYGLETIESINVENPAEQTLVENEKKEKKYQSTLSNRAKRKVKEYGSKVGNFISQEIEDFNQVSKEVRDEPTLNETIGKYVNKAKEKYSDFKEEERLKKQMERQRKQEELEDKLAFIREEQKMKQIEADYRNIENQNKKYDADQRKYNTEKLKEKLNPVTHIEKALNLDLSGLSGSPRSSNYSSPHRMPPIRTRPSYAPQSARRSYYSDAYRTNPFTSSNNGYNALVNTSSDNKNSILLADVQYIYGRNNQTYNPSQTRRQKKKVVREIVELGGGRKLIINRTSQSQPNELRTESIPQVSISRSSLLFNLGNSNSSSLELGNAFTSGKGASILFSGFGSSGAGALLGLNGSSSKSSSLLFGERKKNRITSKSSLNLLRLY